MVDQRWWRQLYGVGVGLTMVALVGCQEAGLPQAAPLDIPVTNAVTKSVTIPLEIVGETIGSTDVTIRSRVEGFVDSMHFREGFPVEKGSLLYKIDPRPFEQKLVQAQGQEATANTALVKAESDLARIRPLAEMKAVSQQDLDAAVAAFEASQSALKVARAQVKLAEIELGYTNIYAPVSGLIGISTVQVGDFVGQLSAGPLNVISTTDPIAVRCSISETDYLRAVRTFDDDKKSGRGEGSPVNLELILADRTLFDHRGRWTKSEREVDSTTGSLTVEAEFPNPDKILRPGMFARIRFPAEKLKDVVLIPSRAISELQGITRVFVIGEDNSVEARAIEVGPKVGQQIVVTSGLRVGERVAVEGLLRLRPGVVVNPTEFEFTKPAEQPPREG